MEPNAASTGASPVGNKRNSVKKLLDAYHDLCVSEGHSGGDGQGGPGMPAPAVKPPMPAPAPAMPGAGAPAAPSMPAASAPRPPMPTPGGSPAGAPPTAPASQAPIAPPQAKSPFPGLGGPMPAGAQPPQANAWKPMPSQAQGVPQRPDVKPGMGTNAASDMGMLHGAMNGVGQAMKGATSAPGPFGLSQPGDITSIGEGISNGLGKMGEGIMGGVKSGMGKAGDLVKTISDHLHNSRESHMSHEKEILQQAIKAQGDRVKAGGSPVPPSMEGHEQEYFDQTRNQGHLNANTPNPKKDAAKSKVAAAKAKKPAKTAKV